MIWLTLTIFTHVLIYESKTYTSYEPYLVPVIIIQCAYTAYAGYYEVGAVRAVLAFIVNVMVLEVCNHYYFLELKNKRERKRT